MEINSLLDQKRRDLITTPIQIEHDHPGFITPSTKAPAAAPKIQFIDLPKILSGHKALAVQVLMALHQLQIGLKYAHTRLISENLLLNTNGFVKLRGLGSCYQPNNSADSGK